MTGLSWFCDQHRVWTAGDCGECDDELIALTERSVEGSVEVAS